MHTASVGLILNELTTTLAGAAASDLDTQRRTLHTFCRSMRIGSHDGNPILEYGLYLPAIFDARKKNRPVTQFRH